MRTHVCTLQPPLRDEGGGIVRENRSYARRQAHSNAHTRALKILACNTRSATKREKKRRDKENEWFSGNEGTAGIQSVDTARRR